MPHVDVVVAIDEPDLVPSPAGRRRPGPGSRSRAPAPARHPPSRTSRRRSCSARRPARGRRVVTVMRTSSGVTSRYDAEPGVGVRGLGDARILLDVGGPRRVERRIEDADERVPRTLDLRPRVHERDARLPSVHLHEVVVVGARPRPGPRAPPPHLSERRRTAHPSAARSAGTGAPGRRRCRRPGSSWSRGCTSSSGGAAPGCSPARRGCRTASRAPSRAPASPVAAG